MSNSIGKKVGWGLVAGAVGGLAASWVMTQFQMAMARAQGKSDPHEGEGEDATVVTAEAVVGRELSEDEKEVAGPLVHYVYGTGIGALYGVLAAADERITLGFGTAYGAAAWLLGDEVAVPALGLGKRPPAPEKMQFLAAHLVYGAVVEGVRRLTGMGLDKLA